MKQITINIPEGKKAEWVNGVLTLVDEKPTNVMERVKTFEDACRELGEDHPFVRAYQGINMCGHENAEENREILAYIKLRIIAAALNEGWQPQYTANEWRWYPWFYLLTEEELSKKDDDWKYDHALISTEDYLDDYAGFVCASSDNAPSDTGSYVGSRLCFKSKVLATYCGKQFINLWKDYILK